MSNRAQHTSASPTAIVTGANRGIGLGVVRQLADRGYRVILSVRDEANGQAAAGKVDAAAGRLDVRRLDVADGQSIAEFARALGDDNRSIDVLVNNAGVAIEGFDGGAARRTMDTNFCGPVLLTDAVVPLMPGGARVVMVSSGAGTLSILSPELAERGIAINAVGPGWVRTDMGGQNASRSVEEGAASVMHGALLPPDDELPGARRHATRPS